MLTIQNVTFDARDPLALARFWAETLKWRITHTDDDEVVVEPPAGSSLEGVVPDLVFIRVNDEKITKNRLHLDLRPDVQGREVARLELLGARRVEIGQDDQVSWVVLADPEGNEFCILRTLE